MSGRNGVPNGYRGQPTQAMMTAETAEKLKTKANECFHMGKLRAAIDLYTEAFALCPKWTVPLVNRALCWRKLLEWHKVIEDCQKVLELDSMSLKGYYFLGLAYINTHRPHEAIQSLEQALELARETDNRIKEEVWRSLAKAKYEAHSSVAAERDIQRSQLLTKLKKLLKEDRAREMKVKSGDVDVIIDQADKLDQEVKLLEDVFRSDQAKYYGEDVPSWCTCQLTLEVFHEPVVTPCGISYEQTALLEHLKKVGNFDPVTRRPMERKDIRKNVGLRNAVQCWLDENRWGWYHAM